MLRNNKFANLQQLYERARDDSSHVAYVYGLPGFDSRDTLLQTLLMQGTGFRETLTIADPDDYDPGSDVSVDATALDWCCSCFRELGV